MPKLPSHTDCDGEYKDDEEYFYAALFPAIANANPQFARVVLQDLRRRAAKPQIKNLMARVVKDAGPVTKGGLQLPPSTVAWYLDERRLQRVAVRIAKGLLFSRLAYHFDDESCVDIRICERPEEMEEMYSLVVERCDPQEIHPEVFTYWHFHFEQQQLHLLPMLFWGAVMFCLCFKDESQVKQN